MAIERDEQHLGARAIAVGIEIELAVVGVVEEPRIAVSSPQAGGSPLPMQGAEQREEAAPRGDIDGDLTFQSLHEQAAAFVVQAAAPDVDGLDARRRLRLDRLIVALAHHEVVLHDPSERRE